LRTLFKSGSNSFIGSNKTKYDPGNALRRSGVPWAAPMSIIVPGAKPMDLRCEKNWKKLRVGRVDCIRISRVLKNYILNHFSN
jgi:hypothetical protein